jgi:4-amino-4-deoxy-L-arabinose transferase-like glycosyltransferase
MLPFMRRLKAHWPLTLILLMALAVRLWGLDFGLPYAYHVDEPRYLNAAVGMWQTGSLNPGWFHQPTLYTYLIALVIGVYYGVGRIAGSFQSTADLFRPPYHFDGLIALPAEFLLARLLTVAFGVLTVWVVYRLCARWMGRWGALTAAAFLALSIFHVTSSHFIATDVPVGLFIMAALYFCALMAENGRPRNYLLTGLFIGLAVGTKYSAYVLIIPAGLAHLLAWRRQRTPLLQPALLLMGITAAAALLLTTPYAVLAHEKFTADLRYEWEHHKVIGHIGSEGNSGQWLLGELLHRSDRWLTLMAGIGFGLAVWRRQWPVLLVFSFALAYFASMATNLVRFERFLLPLIPALAVGAGYAFAELARALPPKRHIFLPLLALLLLIEPAVQVAQFNSRLAQTDVRTTARAWIVQHIPPGSRIARELFAPNLDDEPYQIQGFGFLNEQPAAWYRENGFNYLIFAQARYGVLWRDPARYADLIARYEALWSELELVAEFTGPYVGRPDHVIRIYKVPQ